MSSSSNGSEPHRIAPTSPPPIFFHSFEIGLFDKVEIYVPEDDEVQVIQVVTTIRCDPLKGLISRESPFGKSVLGKKVGDKFTVQVNDNYSYEAEIRSITKSEDDGSAPIMSY